eukprot:8389627-Pyramimonas_sp.AAC.1
MAQALGATAEECDSMSPESSVSRYFEEGGYDCHLSLDPKGDSQVLPGYVSIYLQVTDPCACEVPERYAVSDTDICVRAAFLEGGRPKKPAPQTGAQAPTPQRSGWSNAAAQERRG